ncbi:MAG: saccharopine dehydrogenase C-terminal domain-containing protein [Candidatus Aegiribacteria sp.]
MKVAVLGGGLVGGAAARDLASDGEFRVRVCDASEAALERFADDRGIETMHADLSREGAVASAVAGADLVVGAVPGFMGFQTVRRVIEEGKDIVDISFFPEDPFGLDGPARKRGVRCLVDLGIAPGCSNLVCGRARETFRDITEFSCMVGGLPEERKLPWEYQAPFSPADVLEEYTRPARLVRDGKALTLPPLTERELVDFPGVGTLEAFLTDGLRTLLRGGDIPNMVEKTLRYPGYVDKVLLLRETGFLDSEEVETSGGRVAPLELTSELLFRAWEQKPGDRDLTVMRMKVAGREGDGRPVTRVWNLLDRYDVNSGTTSMARTTGYTCTAGVRLLAREKWKETGVHPPEDLGRLEDCYTFVMDQLKQRGVLFEVKDENKGR